MRIQTSGVIEGKIAGDTQTLDTNLVARILERMSAKYPAIQDLLEQVEKLVFLKEKQEYEKMLDDILEQEGWGKLSKDNFKQIYTFEKQKGYSVRGLSFENQRMIIVNLHQINRSLDLTSSSA